MASHCIEHEHTTTQEADLLCSNQRSGGEAAVFVTFGYLGDRHRLVIARVSCLAKLRHAKSNHFLHRLARRLHVVAGIKLLRALPQYFADGARDGEAVIGVDVNLANAVADAELNLLDRHAPRLLQLATIL